MKPTTEILARISQNSLANKEEVFTKLYRYLLRPDIYFVAYKNLYANNGAATKGVNEDTADGFSEAKIDSIIKALADETYQPMPVRRTYIQKKNNRKKLRPLGIPTFTDKLVQEVLRMILEAVYEPIFLDVSHGFRPKRSCHTALKQLRREFNGTRWFVEGDIKGCFDNINHAVLVGLLNNKIKDARITKLIYKFLKAGYLENWQYHKTYSGTPQGGIISPLLANIYLHELDKFVMKLKSEFDTPGVGQITPEYRELHNEIKRLSHRLTKVTGEEREMVLAEYKPKRQKLMTIPCTAQTDKKLKYVRYADDFLIAVKGNREDCQWIKSKLAEFIGDTLKMELSEDKTLITHSSKCARFLGYDVRVRRSGKIKRGGIGLYNTYILRLRSTGKTDYRQALGRIGGDLRAIYAGMPFGDLTAVEAVTLLADSYFNLFRHNLPLFFENMDKYFAGAGKALSINDYTQPIEDLYGIYQGNPPDNARPMLIQWLDRALTFDMTAQLRARLLMLLAENQQKTGDSAKAKQSLNQAFIVCAGIPEEAVKVQLQNMIREKLNDL